MPTYLYSVFFAQSICVFSFFFPQQILMLFTFNTPDLSDIWGHYIQVFCRNKDWKNQVSFRISSWVSAVSQCWLWCLSLFTGPFFFHVISGAKSSWRSVLSSVFQGSVLVQYYLTSSLWPGFTGAEALSVLKADSIDAFFLVPANLFVFPDAYCFIFQV